MNGNHNKAYTTRHVWPWMFVLLTVVVAMAYSRSITYKRMLLTETKEKYQCLPRTSHIVNYDLESCSGGNCIRPVSNSEDHTERSYLNASYVICGDDHEALLAESRKIVDLVRGLISDTLKDKDKVLSVKTEMVDRFTDYVIDNMSVSPYRLGDAFLYNTNYYYGYETRGKLFNCGDYMMNTIKNMSSYGAMSMSGAQRRYFLKHKLYLDTADMDGSMVLVKRISELLAKHGVYSMVVTRVKTEQQY